MKKNIEKFKNIRLDTELQEEIYITPKKYKKF